MWDKAGSAATGLFSQGSPTRQWRAGARLASVPDFDGRLLPLSRCCGVRAIVDLE
jgi:hypothetical protein